MAHIYNSQLDAFDLYHQIQEAPEKSISILGGPALPAFGHAVAGAAGASISNICTYPLALIITRLQIQRQLRKGTTSPHIEEYKSILDAAQKINEREGGLTGFYVGILSDTSKTIADSFLFFLAYNFLRQTRIQASKTSSRHLSVLDELSVGFVAGAFSKFLTTPIANIVTRKQTSSMLSSRSSNKDTHQASVRVIAQQIHSEKGVQGFWSGYSASLVLTLNPSLTFFFFETLKRSLLPRSKRANPSPQAIFLLAAISKALASSITYPFSLAKSRLQASSSSERDDVSAVKSEDPIVQAQKKKKTKISNNVFAMILQIVRSEGAGALYEGLGGEVLKGFFSHGITMIVKEAVHKFVIHLYYNILKLLRKYPTPQELAELAKTRAEDVATGMGEQVQEAAATAKDGMELAAEKSQSLATGVHEKLKIGAGT